MNVTRIQRRITMRVRFCRCRRVGCSLYMQSVKVPQLAGEPWYGAKCRKCGSRVEVYCTK